MERRSTGMFIRVLIASILVALISSSPASAQAPPDAQSLTVSPPLVELDAPPGQTIEKKISIDNNATNDRNIKSSVQNFGAQGESGQPSLTEEESPYSLSDWIKITPAAQTIKAKQRGEFTAKITVPKSPPPGGRFGAVLFETTNAEGAPDANVKVIPRVTTLILLKVPGAVTEKATIASFTANKTSDVPPETDKAKSHKFFRNGPVVFNTRVRNDGNVQLKPTSKTDIYNIFGSKIGTVESKPGIVLPASVRRYDTTWSHKQLFGYYKAKTTVTYGSTGQTLTASKSFWAAPLIVLIGILIALVAAFFLLWLPRKRIARAIKALRNPPTPPSSGSNDPKSTL